MDEYPGDELFWRRAYGEVPTWRSVFRDIWRSLTRTVSDEDHEDLAGY